MRRIRSVLAAVVVILVMALAPGIVRAGLRVPLLHYYNSATGATAVGKFGPGASHQTFPSPGNFSPGWTHLVHLNGGWQSPGSAEGAHLMYYLFCYRADTGAGAFAWLNNAGQYTTVASYENGSFTTGWTHIVSLGSSPDGNGYWLFFYNSAKGTGALAKVEGEGDITTIKGYGHEAAAPHLNGLTLGLGWTSVVRVKGGLFFYDKNTGSGEFGQILSDGSYRVVQSYSQLFSPGWTHVTYYFSQNVLVYYNTANGSLATAKLDLNGHHATLHSYKYTPGWTIVAPMDGHIFFYNGTNGTATLGEIAGDGTFTYHVVPTGFSPGWTHITYGY